MIRPNDLDDYAMEQFLLRLTPEKAKIYREQLDDETVSIAERKLKLLEAKERYIANIERQIANLDIRQREINNTLRAIEDLYLIPPYQYSEDEELDRFAFSADVHY